MKIAAHTYALIKKFLHYKEYMVWFIENPRGKLRKLDIIPNGYRETVTYCQYGDTNMKATDIWTNSNTWKPRPMCKPRASCHESAPRGSKKGLQGKKPGPLRSVIPHELCEEVVISAEESYGFARMMYNKGF
jgi:hypothetical protein